VCVCDSRAVLSIFIFFSHNTDPVRERWLEFVITVHWFPLFPHHCSVVYNIYASSLLCEPTSPRTNPSFTLPPPSSPSLLYSSTIDPGTERAYIIAADKNNHNQNFKRVNCCGFWLEWQWGRIVNEKRIISLRPILTCHRRTVI